MIQVKKLLLQRNSLLLLFICLIFANGLFAQDTTQHKTKFKRKGSFGFRASGNLGFVSQNQGSVPLAGGYEAGFLFRSPGKKFQFELEANFFHRAANLGYATNIGSNNLFYYSSKETSDGITLPILFRANQIGLKNLDLFIGPQLVFWFSNLANNNGGRGPILEGLAGFNYSLSKKFGIDMRYSTFLTYIHKALLVYTPPCTPYYPDPLYF